MNKFAEQHSRTLQLLGEEKFERLQKAHVLIAGLGGVGGYAAEQLCRAGIGEFTVIDADVVTESNLNRQIIALHSALDQPKTDATVRRMRDINPEVKINTVSDFITDEGTTAVFARQKFDYVVDAIDTLSPKVFFLAEALKTGHKIVSSMGAGGKFTPEFVQIADISKTHNDGLARMLRKRLHRKGIFSGFKAVFSPETVKGEIVQERSQNKNTNVGTISYMPAIFGLYAASVVIRDLTGD